MKRWIPLLLAGFLASSAAALDVASFEKRITVETLPNGLTAIVCERKGAPVFSFAIHVDVGAAQEVYGITGMAHMFEHMAFKGTSEIGTRDWAAEKPALDAVETAYQAYHRLRTTPKAPPEDIAAAEKTWRAAMKTAQSYVVPNEFTEIIDRNGGAGLNAGTAWDETIYFYSLPANRFELWAYLESGRFLAPVFREFYEERDVVQEERRMRVESSPFGRLLEQWVATAFVAHPYHHTVGGWMSDLQSFSLSDANAFYKKNYVPSKLTVVVVGDLDGAAAMKTIREYFGRLPAGPEPEPLRTVEPPQIAEKTVRLFENAQPVYAEGYHRPAATDPDDAVYEVIADVLSNGRVSRLYRALVRDKKVAVEAAGFSGIPGKKYPHLFGVYGLTASEHTNDDVRAAIHAELDRLKNEDVSDEELRMTKTRAKAALIRGLDSNQTLATQLAQAQRRYGDWRELFRQVDRIETVTAADVRRVAAATFRPENRTVVMFVPKEGN